MEKTSNNRLGRMVVAGLVVALALAGVACESQNGANQEDDEAEAVQAQKSDEAPESGENEGEKAGAAAKDETSAGAEGDEAPEKAVVGKPAPDFTLTDTSGEEHTLSDYEGEIVVLEWTNKKCPYVQRHYKEETMTSTLDELGGSESVKWFAIDSSHFATAEASKKWKQKYEAPYPFLIDDEGEVGRTYGAKTTPHMYVIDKEGVLRYKGAIDNDKRGRKENPTNYVLKAVKALQNGKSIEKPSTKPYGCSVKYSG